MSNTFIPVNFITGGGAIINVQHIIMVYRTKQDNCLRIRLSTDSSGEYCIAKDSEQNIFNAIGYTV